MLRARARMAAAALTLALLACSLAGPIAPPATPPHVPPLEASATPAAALAATRAPTPTKPPTHTPAAAPSPAWQPPEHVIGVRVVDGVGEFYDRRTDQRFVVRGANYVFVPAGGRVDLNLLRVGVYDPARTRADFADLASRGYNTARVFLDHCSSGSGCIGSPAGGLNPAYLDNIADMLAAARETGLFLLFTSNDLPDEGGYSEEANSASGDVFAGYRNSYYLTEPAVRATRRYWRDLLTGLIERQAAFDAVLGWQLLNEQWMFIDQPPLSLTSGMVQTTTGSYDMSDPDQKRRMVADGLIHYITEMRAEILAHDPTALVTMGFFAPEIAAPGWYVDTAPLLAGAPLDFFDFHAYPGERPLADYAAAFGMAGYERIPIVLGEYGAFRHTYGDLPAAARALGAWVAESCALGFDGWLHWTYRPANPDAGDQTWGFTDDDGYLLDLFSPATQPDPCLAPDVPGGNLAYGKPVAASAALAGEPAASAVDENEASNWGAGAHPPQWIELDFQAPHTVSEIRLLVSQFPAGPTTHRVYVRGAPADALALAHTFEGPTADGDWLVFTPPSPLAGVRYVRVETTISPSWAAWREIQVFGEVE